MTRAQPNPRRQALASICLAGAIWVVGWVAMMLLDRHLDLANLALTFVLTSVLAALWLPAWLSVGATIVSALAFNWLFVPPRGAFSIGLHQHALLLLAMAALSVIVALLVSRLRRQSLALQGAVARADQLRHWSETLRDAADPLVHMGDLQDALMVLTGKAVAALALKDQLPATDDRAAVVLTGTADADQLAGLWHCLRRNQSMGPGTASHRELPAWYLPMQGRGTSRGAAVIDDVDEDPPVLAHAQALCNQMGVALQRASAAREEVQVRERAQAQEVRNTLLAAIAHDYRTPLATIVGAASSLHEQSARLGAEQRARLASTVLQEASRLSRMTDNTLQLARLDAGALSLRWDWESAEELIGTVLRRARERAPRRSLRARLEPDLPLLWCDAILLSQLLDNLIDNALKYSPENAPVEVLVRHVGEHVMLAVRDRGPGIAPAWKERVFQVFQRGAEAADARASSLVQASRPGVGVGLAVCRSIALVHGGELRLRARGHGGCSFECLLPVKDAPAQPIDTESPP